MPFSLTYTRQPQPQDGGDIKGKPFLLGLQLNEAPVQIVPSGGVPEVVLLEDDGVDKRLD